MHCPDTKNIVTDIGNVHAWLTQLDPVDLTIDRLLRLDRGGLKVSDFVRLFAKCSCGRIMTRRSFEDHTCIPATSATNESAYVY